MGRVNVLHCFLQGQCCEYNKVLKKTGKKRKENNNESDGRMGILSFEDFQSTFGVQGS